jgi:hypothetical protein
MRRRAKVDANQAAIVEALRALGCSVQSLATTGEGVPDLLVGRDGANYLLEVKNRKARGKLNERQRAWHGAWRGQVAVVRNVGEALQAIGFNPIVP